MAVATETLKEFFEPSMGISMIWSARARRSGEMPWTSSPRRRANFSGVVWRLGRLIELLDCSRARIVWPVDLRFLMVLVMSSE